MEYSPIPFVNSFLRHAQKMGKTLKAVDIQNLLYISYAYYFVCNGKKLFKDEFVRDKDFGGPMILYVFQEMELVLEFPKKFRVKDIDDEVLYCEKTYPEFSNFVKQMLELFFWLRKNRRTSIITDDKSAFGKLDEDRMLKENDIKNDGKRFFQYYSTMSGQKKSSKAKGKAKKNFDQVMKIFDQIPKVLKAVVGAISAIIILIILILCVFVPNVNEEKATSMVDEFNSIVERLPIKNLRHIK